MAIALRSGNDEVVKFLDPNIIIPKKRQVTSTMFMQIMRDMMEHEMEQENMNGNQLLYGADTLTELDHESIAVAV